MSTDAHRHYLRDLGYLVKERALAARQRERQASGTAAHEFESGHALAWYEVVSLMQGQAVAFQLPLKDLALDDLDPDKDLL